MNKRAFVFYAALLLVLSSCGTSRITVGNNLPADIYINGASAGKGTATIRRMGFPHTATITAKYDGQKVGETRVSRKFDVITVLLGVCTYYTGFIWAWRYPKEINIPVLNITETQSKKGSWDKPPKSKWD